MVTVIAPVRVQAAGATVYVGDAREVLAALPDHSVDCCVTSPLYRGLRDYDLPPVVWGGDPDCRHRWGCRRRDRHGAPPPKRARLAMVALWGSAAGDGSRFCLLCSAWLGTLGLGPTPELYVDHLVDVFRQLRRVLKPTGTGRPLRLVTCRPDRALRARRDRRAGLLPLRRAAEADPDSGRLAARLRVRGRGGGAPRRRGPICRIKDDAGRVHPTWNAVGIELNPDYIELIRGGRLLHPTQDGASMTPARETKEAA
jgi:hypothetical protein